MLSVRLRNGINAVTNAMHIPDAMAAAVDKPTGTVPTQ